MPTDITGITGIVGQTPRSVSSPESTRSNGAKSTPPAPDRNEDTLDLQSMGRVQELVDSVRDVPVVDASRVQQVRDALASGAHQIDPARVAEKLVPLEQQIAEDTSVV